MIPKGISHTSVQNPTYEFQKEILVPFRKLLVPFRKLLVPFRTTYQGLSFLPVTFTGLADLFSQLRSWHVQCTLYSFVGTLSISFDGPVAKCLPVMQGAWVQIQAVMLITFSWLHPWKPRFKSGFHNSFWDYLVPDRISWMTLEIYK